MRKSRGLRFVRSALIEGQDKGDKLSDETHRVGLMPTSHPQLIELGSARDRSESNMIYPIPASKADSRVFKTFLAARDSL